MTRSTKAAFGTVAALLPFLISGCGNALVFSTSTLYGIELNALEGGQQTAKVAVQRLEGVSMPTCRYEGPKDWFTTRSCDPKEMRKEAYSTLAIMDSKTGPLLLPDLKTGYVNQVFVTGQAASESVAPRSAASTMRALGGYQTLEQSSLSNALSEIEARSDAESCYDAAAQMLPEGFKTTYAAAKAKGLSNHQAFIAAKNEYLFGKGGGSSPEMKQVTEALEAAAK
jgi:hypothetical protein